MIKEEEDWEDIYKKYSLEEIPWHSDEPDKYLVELLNKNKVSVGIALDACSGPGTNTIYLAKHGFSVTGIDISHTAIKIAKHRAKEAGVAQQCTFISGDILTKTLPQTTFDFIFDRGCYHHIPKQDKPRFIERIHKSLKNKGKYFLICLSDKNSPWEKNVSQAEIKTNFSKYFDIGIIRDYLTIEKTGIKLHFYHVLMTKK